MDLSLFEYSVSQIWLLMAACHILLIQYVQAKVMDPPAYYSCDDHFTVVDKEVDCAVRRVKPDKFGTKERGNLYTHAKMNLEGMLIVCKLLWNLLLSV